MWLPCYYYYYHNGKPNPWIMTEGFDHSSNGANIALLLLFLVSYFYFPCRIFPICFSEAATSSRVFVSACYRDGKSHTIVCRSLTQQLTHWCFLDAAVHDDESSRPADSKELLLLYQLLMCNKKYSHMRNWTYLCTPRFQRAKGC